MYMQKLTRITEIKIRHAQRFHNLLKALNEFILEIFFNGIISYLQLRQWEYRHKIHIAVIIKIEAASLSHILLQPSAVNVSHTVIHKISLEGSYIDGKRTTCTPHIPQSIPDSFPYYIFVIFHQFRQRMVQGFIQKDIPVPGQTD